MNEEICIEIDTKYTYEEFLKLSKFSIYKKNKNVTYLVLFCIVLMSIIDIYLLFVKEFYLFIILTVIIIGYILFVKIFPEIIAKRKYKEYKNKEKSVDNKFVFKKDRLSINNNTDEKSELKYININKIYETDTNFYLYTKKKLIYIVSKEKITLKTVDKLRGILKRILKLNYIEI